MRILHVITSLRTGGAEKLMVDLLPRLEANGNEVELAVFDGTVTPFYKELDASGIRIHSFHMGGSVYDPRHIVKLIRLMRGFDIVHTHNTSPQLFAAIASRFLSTKNRPLLITTEHNTSNRRRGVPLLRLVDLWMYRQYKRIICISEQARVNLLNHLGEGKERMLTIYNGIDVQKYRMVSAPSENKNPEVVTITMVAAFREQKDHKTLIRSMALLPENYVLQLVGIGDPILIQACHALVDELGLQQRVNFLGMRTDIPEILALSDIVVLSSHYEGLSLSSIEGLASGKPFVASDVDGLHEIVNGYGLLFRHEDSNHLASVLLALMNDKSYYQKTASDCLKRASCFEIKQMSSSYLELYANCMEES